MFILLVIFLQPLALAIQKDCKSTIMFTTMCIVKINKNQSRDLVDVEKRDLHINYNFPFFFVEFPWPKFKRQNKYNP